MAIVPIAFKGKIKEIVISEGNKLINAEFGFDNLSISLFREFPKASVGIKEFWLRGKETFADDTLAYVGSMEVAVNLKSIFGNEGFDVTKITIKDTYLNAIVLEDGRANWDIMYPSDTEIEEDTMTSNFRILLEKIEVNNLNIVYNDHQTNMHACIQGLGATCSGNMSSDRALLDLQATISALTFKIDEIPLLSKARIGANLNIDADFVNGKYTLKENTLSLNAIQATIDGWAALPKDAPLSMDLRVNTTDIKFKELLSLIPAIYAKDFEDLKADGTVSLHAYAKGELTENTLPQFEASLKVNNGNFRYPALPTGVDDIRILATVNNPGGDINLTKVSIDQFSLNILGNPFGITAKVKTPISDPDFSATAKGILDLGKIKEIYPLENISLNGILRTDMGFSGRLSYIEKEQYDKFKANGILKLENMLVQIEGIPEVAIEQSTFTFTPHYLNLSETKVLIGENDIVADCRFDNYMAFVLKGETLKGQLNLTSSHMNLNDFMTSSESTSKEKEDNNKTNTPQEESDTIGVLIIPQNIDFNMNVNMAEVLFSEMKMLNLNGNLQVKDGIANMSNLSMQTMGGTVMMNGNYATPSDYQAPELKASFALNNISFAQAFKEIELVKYMAPIFDKLSGNFSGKIAVDTKLDDTMSPQLNTLTASGSLSTNNLSLSNVTIINHIAEATKREELKDISAKDLNVEFTIQDGRINTKPFEIKAGNMTLNLSGTTGLDQSIDYIGKLKLPEGNAFNSIDLKIGGTFNSPKISIDTQSMIKQATSTVASKALESVEQQFGINITDSEKQKEELIKAAQQTAEKLIAEAEKQKANLVSKAGNNAIKKLAAEKAGDALITTAKEQGAKLISEAQKKGECND